jgi:hypothetical protein
MEEEKSPLLGAEYPRPSAIDVGQAAGAENDRIFRPDHSGAAGTRPRWLLHQLSLVAMENSTPAARYNH